MTGTESEIDTFVSLVRTYGIKELVRTGAVVYRVDMPGLGQPNGNVQVTSYGSTANRGSSWVAK